MTWNNCADTRPWIIVGERIGTEWECFPISGRCYGSWNFELKPDHPGFPLTGLNRQSYICYASIFMVPETAIGKRRGSLTGPLLDAFIAAAGL